MSVVSPQGHSTPSDVHPGPARPDGWTPPLPADADASLSAPAIVAALAGDAVALLGVVALGWNAPSVFVFAWVDTAVVGLFILLRVARCEGDRDAYWRDAERSPYSSEPTHFALAWRFFRTWFVGTLAFGLIGFMVIAASTKGGDSLPTILEAAGVSLVGLAAGAVAVAVVQGVVYVRDYLGGGEYRTAVSGDLQQRYIAAVLPVGGAWLIGIVAVGTLGVEPSSAPLATALGLLAIKTAGDLLALGRRRRRAAPATPSP
jgi:hypothetical protein